MHVGYCYILILSTFRSGVRHTFSVSCCQIWCNSNPPGASISQTILWHWFNWLLDTLPNITVRPLITLFVPEECVIAMSWELNVSQRVETCYEQI